MLSEAQKADEIFPSNLALGKNIFLFFYNFFLPVFWSNIRIVLFRVSLGILYNISKS